MSNRTQASRELLAPRDDVWALIAEPYNLPDWWPLYAGVRPDRRGLAENARWQVNRRGWFSGFAGLLGAGLRGTSNAQAMIVIRRVVPGYEIRWHDLALKIDAGVTLDNAGTGRTRATVFVEAPWWRSGGARGLPHEALTRLYDLCQTAATL